MLANANPSESVQSIANSQRCCGYSSDALVSIVVHPLDHQCLGYFVVDIDKSLGMLLIAYVTFFVQ